MRNMNIDYVSLRSMPITYRTWFINKFSEIARNNQPKDQYGLDDDTPISSPNN